MKKERRIKRVSVILSVFLVFQMIPFENFAVTKEESNMVIAEEESEETVRIVAEDAAEREESVKHFLNSDGSFSAVSYLDPVHFKKAGQWRDINNNLVLKESEKSKDEFVYVPENSPVNVSLNERYGENSVSVMSKGYELTWSYARIESTQETILSENAETDESDTSDSSETEYVDSASNADENIDTDIEKISEGIENDTESAVDDIDDVQLSDKETNDVSEEELTNEETELINSGEEIEENDDVVDVANYDIDADETVDEVTTADEESENTHEGTYASEEQDVKDDAVCLAKKIEKNYCIDKDNPDDEFTVLKNLSDGIIYEDVLPSVSLEYILSSVYFKENIVLKNKEAQHSFTVKYRIGELQVEQLNEKEILLKDKDGYTVFDLYAPCMEDAKGAASDKITFSVLSNEKGYLTLSISADDKWLESTDREYPVKIDPYIFQEVKNHDNDATAIYRNATYPNGTMCVGNDNDDNYGKAKGYIKFSLPTLRAGDTITGGKMCLAQYTGTYGYSHVGNSTLRLNAYRVDSSWSESSIRNSTGYSGLPSVNSVIVDYQKVKQVSDYTRCNFDISRTVKQWYQGTSNYGICIRADDQNAWALARFITSDNPSFVGGEPKLRINYRNNKGLESYWSYHDIDLGESGTAYINDYTGNLVVAAGIASTPGLNMPANVSLIYNGYMAAKANSFVTKCGSGWSVNVQEFLKVIDENGSSLEQKLYTAGYRYIYTDSDGTEHYLWENDDGKIVDEDGLGLTLTVRSSPNENSEKYIMKCDDGSKTTFRDSGYLRRIYDSEGNFIHVVYSSNVTNRILRVEDGAGRSISFSYDSDNRITEVHDEAGRTVTFTYLSDTSVSRLSRLTYPDGTYTSFAYSNGKITKIRCRDGIRYKFTYPNSNSSAVSSRVSEVRQYSSNDTGDCLAANEGRTMSLDYSKLNRTVFTDRDDRKETYVFDNLGRTLNVFDASGGSSMYTYQSTTTKGKKANTTKSANQTSKFVDNLFKDHSFESSLSNFISSSAALSTAEKYIGYKSVKLSSSGYVNQKVTGTSGTYTVSAYVKGDSLSSKVQLGVTCYNSSETSIETTNSQSFAVTDVWTRVSYTFTLPDNTAYFRPKIKNSGSDNIWVDCIQVEKSSVMNPYNMVVNGGFENTTSSAWYMSNSGSNDGYDTGTVYGRYAILYGDGTSNKRFYQKIQVNKAAKKLHLSLSGLAYAYSVPLEDDRKFSLGIKAVFTDGTETSQFQDFNAGVGGVWQYTSGTFGFTGDDANKTVDYIYVYCCYHDNANYARFDHIQLNIDETGTAYTYDSEGNLITATDNAGRKQHYSYSNANEILNATASDGNEYEYTYSDSKPHRLLSAVSNSSDVEFSFTYGSFGNATSVTCKGNASSSSSGKYIKNVTQYSEHGEYVLKTGNDFGYLDERTYDETTGQVVKYKDRRGYAINYSYDSTRNALTGITGQDGVSLGLSYNSKNQVTRLETALGTRYTFTYDPFGKLQTVKAGNLTLVTKNYAINNGNLTSNVYANGLTENYNYDSLNRLTSISHGTSKKYVWTYNTNGQVGKYKDNFTGKTYQHSYDNIGRLSRTDISDGSWLKYSYNTLNNITKLKYCFNDFTRTVNYDYLDTDNLPLSVSFNSSGEIYNEYDSLNRLKYKQYVAGDNVNDIFVRYGYYNYSETESERTTSVLKTVKYETNGGNGISNRFYEYDRNGNITTVRSGLTDQGAIRVKCKYDKSNRLTQYDSLRMGKSYTFSYDENGNITEKKEYDFTTDSLGNATRTVQYSYTNSNFKDLLTSYNGHSITYDSIGNMTTYNGNTYSWNGKRLTSISNSSNQSSYTYGADGVRTSKTVNGTTTEFFLSGSNIIAQKTGNNVLWFFYDSEGSRVGLVKNGTTYYYLYDLEGNVIGIVKATDGTVVASYDYDAWGNCVVHNADGFTIGDANPFRYKGYYYDTESDLYYLNSRYYNPEFGRFISADEVMKYDDVNGINLYAYCKNNPIKYVDGNGNWPRVLTLAVAGICVAAGCIAGAAVALAVFCIQTVHYDYRQSLNVELPSNIQDAKDNNWKTSDKDYKGTKYEGGPAADCHQYSSPEKTNVKWVSDDGHREVIFSIEENVVNDPRDIGTYNFCPYKGTVITVIGHGVWDFLPWALLGNSDDDWGPIVNEPISWISERI